MNAHALRGFLGWPRGPVHLAIGVFDGVHVGHQALIGRLVAGARAAGAHALAATFEPMPGRFLDPAHAPAELTDAEERLELLRRAGADAVVIFPFDRAFADLAPAEFIARLREAADLRRVVVGSDFQFGRGRAGAVATLREAGERSGFTVEEVAPVLLDGAVVSSTRIRQILAAGDLPAAERLLGRPYRVVGTVVGGDRRGTALGYPTANLRVGPDRLLPRDGIYAALVEVNGARHAAAASLGVRPTFGSGLARRLEAFLLDYSGDLYGATVRLTFVKRLRDERRFDSPAALVAQIDQDVAETRRVLSGAGG